MSKPHPDPAYRDWVGRHGCPVPHPSCGGKIDIHHVRGRRFGDWIEGTGNLVPLCHHHHMEGHTGGWLTFAKKYDVDLPYMAAKLGEQYGRQTNYDEGGQE